MMFKDAMEHMQRLSLVESDSEDEEEDESDSTLLLSMIDELFRVWKVLKSIFHLNIFVVSRISVGQLLIRSRLLPT